MPLEDPLLVKFQKVADEIAINNQMTLLIEGTSEESLTKGTEEIINTLKSHPDIEYAVSSPKQDWFEHNLAWVTTDEDLDELLKIGSNITNQEKLKAYQDRFSEFEKSQEGFRIISVGLAEDPLNVDINDVLSMNSPFDRVERKLS